MSINTKILLLPAFFVLLFVFGCAMSPSTQPVSTHQQLRTSPLPSVTNSPTKTPIPSLVPTLTSSATLTSTSFPTPSQTPVPIVLAPVGLAYCTSDGLWLVGSNENSVLIAPDCNAHISNNYQFALYEQELFQKDIWYIDLITGETTNLSNTELPSYDAQWSLDNNSVFYLEYREEGPWAADIWRGDIISGEKHNLTNTSDRFERDIQFWPNSNILMFASSNSDDIHPHQWGYLTTMQTNGSQYQMLLDEPLSVIPQISPDGQTLAFRGGYLYSQSAGILKLEFDVVGGMDQEKVWLEIPSWSPDGNYISWSLYVEEGDKLFTGIGVLNLMDSTLQLLHLYSSVSGEGYPPKPEWSTDGKWLIFQAYDEKDDEAGLWVTNKDGSEEHFLGNCFDPVWSLDNQWLAVTCYSPETVWIAEVGQWKLTKTNLPENSRARSWLDADKASDWAEYKP